MAPNSLHLFAAAAISAAVFSSAPAQSQPADAPAGQTSKSTTAKILIEGDPAPSLDGITWLKGEPVRAFERGRIYIVEIWATWCGPCKRGIPHLTELQARHKDKLTVIGISCWERADTPDARIAVARSFVESQGDAMNYTVAADGDGIIVRDWMQPAGRRSIPTAFIVDEHGAIAWIGNPLTGMDAVLDKVLAGGFDARAEAAKAKLAAAAKKVKDEMFARANLAANSGNSAEALQLADQLLASETDPASRIPYHRLKLRVLLKSDEPAAYALARSLLEGELKDSDFGLYTLATSILSADKLAAPDYPLIIALAERSAQLAAPGNAAPHETLAQARFRAGDIPGAIAAAEKALEAMKQPGANSSAAAIARIQKQLEDYRAAQPPK